MPSGITLTLSPSSLRLRHGSSGEISVMVDNQTPHPHDFQLLLLGEAAGWVKPERSRLTIPSGGRGETRLVVAPPQSVSPSTTTVLGVRVVAEDDTGLSRVEELPIAVGPRGTTPARPSGVASGGPAIERLESATASSDTPNQPTASRGGVRVSLLSESIAIAPGSSGVVEARVYNTGSVLDEFVVEAVGIDRSWVTAVPQSISLLPDQDSTVRVTIAMPEGASMHAGEHTIGLRFRSVIHSQVARVEELRLSVRGISNAALTLEPQTVRGGSSTDLTAHILNRGNEPVEVGLSGTDQEKAIQFSFQPPRLMIPPFGNATSRVKMRARRPMAGSPAHRAFEISGGPSMTARGTFIQKARVSRFIVRLLSMLLGLGLLAGIAYAIPSVRNLVFATTTLPGEPATIESFFPTGEPDANGCVTLSWQVTNASEVVLKTPTDQGTVDSNGSRQVCGSTGDAVTLEAVGENGVTKTADYQFNVGLTMGNVDVSVNGRTVIFDLETNQTSDVTVALIGRGAQETSTGKNNHHLEFTNQGSGSIQWTATASLPGQPDVMQSGTIDMPFYSLRVTLVDGPRFVTNPTTTTTVAGDGGFFAPIIPAFPGVTFVLDAGLAPIGFWFGYVASPGPRFLELDCPGDWVGEVVDELFIPLNEDGSADFTVSIDFCIGDGPVQNLPDEPLNAQEIKVNPGFEQEESEKTVVFPATDGVIEMTLRIERVQTADRPEYP